MKIQKEVCRPHRVKIGGERHHDSHDHFLSLSGSFFIVEERRREILRRQDSSRFDQRPREIHEIFDSSSEEKFFFYLRAYLKILQFSSSPMITMDDDWRIHASSSRTHASIAFPHARADGVLEDRRSSQVCYHSQPPDPRDQDCTVKVESMTMTRVLPSPGGRYALGISGVKDFDP